MRLKNKVAVITGAGRGLGKAAALTFAREGARVVVCDIDESNGRKVVEEIVGSQGQALFVRADVSRFEDARHLVDATVKAFKTIDILINNAGITRDASLLKMTEEQFEQVISVNLKGVFNCTKAVAPVMIAAGRGKIINVSSVVALYGNFGQTNYVASKAGVIGMTKTWARELGRKGINVNAVAPGFIATEMVQAVPQDILDAIKERTPLKRLGEPQEIANAFLFLASDEASFINGAVLSVDGGLVL